MESNPSVPPKAATAAYQTPVVVRIGLDVVSSREDRSREDSIGLRCQLRQFGLFYESHGDSTGRIV